MKGLVWICIISGLAMSLTIPFGTEWLMAVAVGQSIAILIWNLWQLHKQDKIADQRLHEAIKH